MTDTCTMLGVKDICISLGVKKEDKRAVTFWSDRYLYNARSERSLYISGSEERRQKSSDFLE